MDARQLDGGRVSQGPDASAPDGIVACTLWATALLEVQFEHARDPGRLDVGLERAVVAAIGEWTVLVVFGASRLRELHECSAPVESALEASELVLGCVGRLAAGVGSPPPPARPFLNRVLRPPDGLHSTRRARYLEVKGPKLAFLRCFLEGFILLGSPL